MDLYIFLLFSFFLVIISVSLSIRNSNIFDYRTKAIIKIGSLAVDDIRKRRDWEWRYDELII